MATTPYDPRLVIVILGGHEVSGYADGTFINVEPHGDGVTKEVGADGEAVRSIDPDETATVTLTVQYGTETAAWATARYKMDRDTHGEGGFPIMIKDLKGSMLFSAEDAWIQNNPARNFEKTATNCEINIDTGKAAWS